MLNIISYGKKEICTTDSAYFSLQPKYNISSQKLPKKIDCSKFEIKNTAQ